MAAAAAAAAAADSAVERAAPDVVAAPGSETGRSSSRQPRGCIVAWCARARVKRAFKALDAGT
eukprot:116530-Chlamydomonas_euryale.AAC.1